LAALLLPLAATGPAWATPDSGAALREAASAAGLDSLHSIEFSGSGSDYALGQAPSVNAPWPQFTDKTYSRVVNLDAWATRLQRTRTQATNPPRGGGGQPVLGEQTQTQALTAASPAGASLENELAVTLPQAFLKAAEAAPDVSTKHEVHDGASYTVVSFTAPNKATTSGWIDSHKQVVRVKTAIANPALGDVAYEAQFSDYKDFGGVRFPAHIVQKADGYPTLDLTVSEVTANAPAADIADAPAPAATLASEKLGDGVYLITGGYAAVAVEFKDHILIVEGGQDDHRSEAVIAEAKRLIPGKPITQLVNTHSHVDHSGGVRDYVAEGATIITYKANEAYFRKIWANPHTLAPDRLSQHPTNPKFTLVDDQLKIAEGDREVDIYHLHDFGHHDGTLVAYLPKEKVLIEADGFNPPPAPIAQTPVQINAYQQSLAANIDRLHLDVDRIVPIHLPADNRKVTLAELYKAIGRS
jgi:glyoxylase-like metal-dependent hydrolase (beta-lactamase superfamily II)